MPRAASVSRRDRGSGAVLVDDVAYAQQYVAASDRGERVARWRAAGRGDGPPSPGQKRKPTVARIECQRNLSSVRMKSVPFAVPPFAALVKGVPAGPAARTT